MALAPKMTIENIWKPGFSGRMTPGPLEETPSLKEQPLKRPSFRFPLNDSFLEAN